MRRSALTLVFLALAAVPASAQDAGGAAAPGSTFNTGKAGGVQPGTSAAPVAHLSVPRSVQAGAEPRIRVRFEERGVTWVVARAVVLRAPGNDVAGRVDLGRVPTGRRVDLAVGNLTPGTYVVRVHARDRWNNQLRRSGRTTGKATFVVRAEPAPEPEPAPDPPAGGPAPISGEGVFPVAGPYTFGDGMGADRGDHSHQGQDMAAAAGTPLIAPVSGTVVSTAYQASGAGYYVVMNGSDGFSYFFAHMQQGSFAVEEGDAVSAGQQLGRVGSSGRSSGPHLHFEMWANGWRTSAKSHPVDPMPSLRSWAN